MGPGSSVFGVTIGHVVLWLVLGAEGRGVRLPPPLFAWSDLLAVAGRACSAKEGQKVV